MSSTETETKKSDDPGRPLSEDEKSLLKRLLAEPLEFPVEFRAWLKNFFETAGVVLPRSSIAGIGGTGVDFKDFPPGVILPWAGASVPIAALPCNGAAISRAFYADLFTAIGTVWGTGDGSTTFNVPDLRDRALYGVGTHVVLAQTDGRAAGTRGGPAHHHAVSIPNSSSGYNTLNGSAWGTSDGVGDHNHGLAGTVVKAINGADSDLAVPSPSGGGAYPTSGAGGHSHYGTYSAQVGGTVNVSGVVNGDTSGAYAQDKPAFAGIQYVIATGKTA